MIFDTDILIWIERGNPRAAKLVNDDAERLLSVQSYMEWLQGAQSQRQQGRINAFLKALSFEMLPLRISLINMRAPSRFLKSV